MPASDKVARQKLIKKLIKEGEIDTQMQLVELLAANGKKVTQATVSRDLEEMDVYSARLDDGRTVYVLEEGYTLEEKQQIRESLIRVMGEWVESISVSGNMVVLKTSPGSAHVVASALDRSRHPQILGTLAGDDTLLVLVNENVKSSKHAQMLSKEFKEMSGIPK